MTKTTRKSAAKRNPRAADDYSPSKKRKTNGHNRVESTNGLRRRSANFEDHLVDDDVDFVAINKALLEQHSYEVVVAYNGEECLDKVRDEVPDLIILDMMMTSRSEGYGISRELRSSELTKKIPLLMLTSVNMTLPIKLEPDEKWLPVDLLIEKPVEPGLLLDVVREMTLQKSGE